MASSTKWRRRRRSALKPTNLSIAVGAVLVAALVAAALLLRQ